MRRYIPVNTPKIGFFEKKYVLECLDTGWISSEGPFVEKFEQKFSNYVQRDYGIAVSNGTAALDIAISALNLEKGDEVILPAFTIISCVNQIVRCGAIPVLVDSDQQTWNMDVSLVREKVTARTRAIMIVHTYGLPVDIDPILSIAKEFNLKVIEDSAQAHGLLYKGKPCGSFGDISTFSFYPNKNITTGEGGMIVTNDLALSERARSLRNLCFRNNERFVHDELGWNYRLTNIQAAIGLGQMENINSILHRKREIGELYNRLLENVKGINLPCPETSYANNDYWVYGITIQDSVGFNAKKAMSLLNERGVGTRPFFCPMNLQPVLKKNGFFVDETYPVAEFLYESGFYIPSGVGIGNEDIIRSAEAVVEIFK